MLLLTILFVAVQAYAKVYYVDAYAGDDKNNGISATQPWQSIQKVNKTHFKPGDKILFKRGSVWMTGEGLQPKGSGKKGAPIVLSSYGKGDLPLIIGNGFVKQGVVTLYNQEYWEISELELTNWAAEKGERRGVEINARNAGTLRHIYLRDLVIHHVKGIRSNDNFAKRTAGIAVFVSDDRETATRYDDLLIEDCTIYTIENQGIVFDNLTFKAKGTPGNNPKGELWPARMFTDVKVRNNVVYDISKNAMIVRLTDGGVVENNVCFNTAHIDHGGNTIFSRNARGTVFQYNEGFMNRSPNHDGSLYDPDMSSPETIWRYSYSHDNAHGLVWFCTDPPDNDLHVYDNISEGDHGMLVYINYPLVSAYVYRNMFYASDYVHSSFFRENPTRVHKFFTINNNVMVNRSDSVNYEYITPNKPQKESSVRDVRDNMFLGKPLKGKYTSVDIDLKKFRKFHRGFLHANTLDTLVGNKVELFRPAASKSSGHETVGRINNLPVYRWELERELARTRWECVDASGRIDREENYRKAVNVLKMIKVQQQEMAKRGMPEAAVFDHFDQLLEKENEFRSKHAALENVMFFGPKQYDRDDFWQYFFANAQESLRKLMSRDVLAVSKEETFREYEKNKDKK